MSPFSPRRAQNRCLDGPREAAANSSPSGTFHPASQPSLAASGCLIRVATSWLPYATGREPGTLGLARMLHRSKSACRVWVGLGNLWLIFIEMVFSVRVPALQAQLQDLVLQLDEREREERFIARWAMEVRRGVPR
jgi:hypothetical protein